MYYLNLETNWMNRSSVACEERGGQKKGPFLCHETMASFIKLV